MITPRQPLTNALLSPEDGPSVETINANGASPVVLVCEHASNRIPVTLNDLGLTAAQRETHIAWDLGARALARSLSKGLDAPLVAARFSRLVYDCNRPPGVASAMPSDTEVCVVPGNEKLSDDERQNRTQALYEPFHLALANTIAERCSQAHRVVLVTIHSFTPEFYGKHRDVEVGFLHGSDARLATLMHTYSNANWPFDCRLNEPYSPTDGVLHTIEKHLNDTTTPSVMIEIRNDLLGSEQSIHTVNEYLHDVLVHAIDRPDNTLMSQSNEHAL